jgi:cytidine deaminase
MELRDGESLEIFLPGEAPRTLSEFLPRAFGPGDLHKSARLLDESITALSKEGLPSGDPVADAAFEAARKSYAPYSGGFAGVALELEGAGIVAGRYAENAAFNPSMSPLASALTLALLEGHENRSVLRAVLVEAGDTPISHRRACEEVLASWAPDSELECFSVSKKE